MEKDYKEKEYLSFVLSVLGDVRDGLLDDGIACRYRAAFHLGSVMASIDLTLQDLAEEEQ